MTDIAGEAEVTVRKYANVSFLIMYAFINCVVAMRSD